MEEIENLTHTSKPRNRLISQAFYDVEEIERYGSGFKRIKDAFAEGKLPTPEYKEVSGGFITTFKKKAAEVKVIQHSIGKVKLNSRKEKALAYVKKHGQINLQQYIEISKGVTERTLQRDLSELAEEGLLKRRGIGRSTVYF